MQLAMHDCTTIRVAHRTDLGGRAAADEVNLDRSHNRIGKVSALVVATLILPALAYAQGGSPIAQLQAKVTALQATVTTLQNQVNADTAQITALQTTVTALQNQGGSDASQITALQNQVNSLQTQLTAAQPVLALAPFVSVDPNPENGVIGPNISFKGANIHILSGSGATNDNGILLGLGNLIIGYDELFSGTPPAGARGGSHNLVIGRYNQFTSAAFGGLVAGEINTISAEGGVVSGGQSNTASGGDASVSGGASNTASGNFASVSGGSKNTATGGSVSGGFDNTASGTSASVSGGFGNTASGGQASVSGGNSNTASGFFSSVSGGTNNTASGQDSSVIGERGNTANLDLSIRPQPPFNP